MLEAFAAVRAWSWVSSIIGLKSRASSAFESNKTLAVVVASAVIAFLFVGGLVIGTAIHDRRVAREATELAVTRAQANANAARYAAERTAHEKSLKTIATIQADSDNDQDHIDALIAENKDISDAQNSPNFVVFAADDVWVHRHAKRKQR
jgi:hypothetical protein